MYKNKTLEFFSKINITFKENYLIDNNVTKEKAKDFIKKANIIYLKKFWNRLFGFSKVDKTEWSNTKGARYLPAAKNISIS